jgi:hypothetical protein
MSALGSSGGASSTYHNSCTLSRTKLNLNKLQSYAAADLVPYYDEGFVWRKPTWKID